ncbi:sensor histidine kinase [Candidatus Chloroploca sp. Khr17]|uniref:sensor histidine kinase n=1 Tax=Candidatus Chloroploca sp. Khr17 TaxID=2496869 RepID=UPI00101C1BDC|nr:hypothetical protein [Candidatus Chloroploca sp. Khr17]
MKRLAGQWQSHLSDHIVFFSYRWLAWIFAALTLTLPGRPTETLPRDAGLLLLIGVLNVVATALAQGYVQFARQRPTLLVVDLVVGIAILWLSGSTMLPFLPFALGALVLPALLYGSRGSIVGGSVFIILDLFGLAVINRGSEVTLAEATIVLRVVLPLLFSLFWWWVAAIVMKSQPQPARGAEGAHGLLASPLVGSADPETAQRTGVRPRALERPPSEEAVRRPAHPGITSSLVATRSTEQRADPARKVFYELMAIQGRDRDLMAMLDQLGAAIADQAGIEVRVNVIGEPRPLHRAIEMLLLRIAHEALLNVQHHAHAHIALMVVRFAPNHVILMIQDDGVGLLDGTYERPGVHALRVVRYRLAEFEGELHVVERESGGLTVEARMPTTHI